jgi:hypothetical protein
LKKCNYFDVDCGFFPVPIKLCFTRKAFYEVLKDHGITTAEDPKPLDYGVAETHSFNTTKEAVVVVIFNLEMLTHDEPAYLAGIVSHEMSHVIERILEHIGEQKEEFGEETRAYLLQHMVEQVYLACSLQREKDAKRKEVRAKTGKKGEGKGGTVPEVGEPRNDGGAGPSGDISAEDIPSRAEGPEGEVKPQANTHDSQVAKFRSRHKGIVQRRTNRQLRK